MIDWMLRLSGRGGVLLVGFSLLVHGGLAAESEKTAVPEIGVADATKEGRLPLNAQAMSQRAAKAFAAGDWKTAREVYEELLKLEPYNALVWANLGAVEQQSGRLNEAVEAFEQSVRFNPALVQSWIALGLAYSDRGDLYLAVSALTRAIHEDPVDARPHNYLAIAMKRIGWTQAAQAELQRAVELKEDYGIAHFNLALTYLEQRPAAMELARRHYQRARDLGVAADEIVELKLAATEREREPKTKE